jgi:hypothetical protein
MSGDAALIQARREQRMTALRKANEKRTKIAQLKRLIGDQSVDPIDVLNQREHPWYDVAGSMQVQDFLFCIRGFGRKTVAEVLGEFALSGKTTIERLSMQRRAELIHLIKILLAK